ncbi:hypothetical protein QVD17_19978 [Tagetes erecta]|uniref:Uncharacterized protein n=1 Tax=Tagetes erecta TaxID=13708 RepID=A0AAD8KKW5_TARER|nr:hypothetical protein QVD17_19978 [Tagetes erecta]
MEQIWPKKMNTTLTPYLTMTAMLNSNSKTCCNIDENGKEDGCFESGSVYTKIHIDYIDDGDDNEERMMKMMVRI